MQLEHSATGHRFGSRSGRRRWIRRALVGLGLATLAWGCDTRSQPAVPAPAPAPSGERVLESRSFQLESASERGRYRVSARPAAMPLELHQMHDWIVGIELIGASPEIPTAVSFDGGMPSHGHGFVTRPRVTRNIGGGEFLVEGVKFHMPGEWVLQITVTSGSSSDRVTLPLTIDP